MGSEQHEKINLFLLHHQCGTVIELSDASTSGWFKFEVHEGKEHALQAYMCLAGDACSCEKTRLATSGTNELKLLRAGHGSPFTESACSHTMKSWSPDVKLRHGTLTVDHVHPEGDGNRLIIDSKGFIYLGVERGLVVHGGFNVQNIDIRDARQKSAEVRCITKDIQTLQAEKNRAARTCDRRKKKSGAQAPVVGVQLSKSERDRYYDRIGEMKRQNDGLMPCIDAIRQWELNSAYRSKMVMQHHTKNEWRGAGDAREWSQIVTKTPSRIVQTRLPCHAWTKMNGHEMDCRCRDCQRFVHETKAAQDRCKTSISVSTTSLPVSPTSVSVSVSLLSVCVCLCLSLSFSVCPSLPTCPLARSLTLSHTEKQSTKKR